MLSDYSMLVTLQKRREEHFRLIGTNGFYVKAKKKRFTTAGWCCRQYLKYENVRSSSRRLPQNPAARASFNQTWLMTWFMALLLPMPSTFLRLPTFTIITVVQVKYKTTHITTIMLFLGWNLIFGVKWVLWRLLAVIDVYKDWRIQTSNKLH